MYKKKDTMEVQMETDQLVVSTVEVKTNVYKLHHYKWTPTQYLIAWAISQLASNDNGPSISIPSAVTIPISYYRIIKICTIQQYTTIG